MKLMVSHILLQDYRAKKRSRIQKMLSDRLKQDAKEREDGNTLDSLRDLQQVMAAVGQNVKAGTKTKGSRFAHTEKLMYGKVRDILSIFLFK